jgi:hypothetical protein
MANVKRLAVAIYPSATFTPLKNAIDSMQLPFITSTEIVDNDNKLVLTFTTGVVWYFTRHIEDWNRYIKINQTVLGQTTTSWWIHTLNTTSQPATVTFCGSSTMFYLHIRTSSSDYLMGLYLALDDNASISGVGRLSQGQTIQSLGLFHSQTSAEYRIPVTLNYSAGPNKIQYMNHANIVSNSVKYFSTSDMLACSTLTADRVVTFGSDNYYAVDTNLLVPMDKEPNNG